MGHALLTSALVVRNRRNTRRPIHAVPCLVLAARLVIGSGASAAVRRGRRPPSVPRRLAWRRGAGTRTHERRRVRAERKRIVRLVCVRIGLPTRALARLDLCGTRIGERHQLADLVRDLALEAAHAVHNLAHDARLALDLGGGARGVLERARRGRVGVRRGRKGGSGRQESGGREVQPDQDDEVVD